MQIKKMVHFRFKGVACSLLNGARTPNPKLCMGIIGLWWWASHRCALLFSATHVCYTLFFWYTPYAQRLVEQLDNIDLGAF